MVNSYSETWLHQSSVVAQLSQPLRVVGGRIGRRLVFEPDHISGLGSTDSCHLCLLGRRRVQKCCHDVGVRMRGGEVAAERVCVILCAQSFSDRSLSVDSDAILLYVGMSQGLPGLRVVCGSCNGRP